MCSESGHFRRTGGAAGIAGARKGSHVNSAGYQVAGATTCRRAKRGCFLTFVARATDRELRQYILHDHGADARGLGATFLDFFQRDKGLVLPEPRQQALPLLLSADTFLPHGDLF